MQSGQYDKKWLVENYPPSKLLQQLRNNEEVEIRHTNLQNALRNEIEIAEIVAATGEPFLQPLITYPFERMAYLEAIAVIETELMMSLDEMELYDRVEVIYQKYVDPLNARGKDIEREQMENATKQAEELYTVLNNPNTTPEQIPESPYSQKGLSLYQMIFPDLDSSQETYKPSPAFCKAKNLTEAQARSEVWRMVMTDYIYNNEMQKIVADCVGSAVQSAIDELIAGNYQFNTYNREGEVTGSLPLKRLTINSGSDRHSILLSGPPACGKGNMLMLALDKAHRERGIDPRDFVKVNTDTHRRLVVQGYEEKLGEDKKFHASLNNDEASYITRRAYELVEAKLEKDAAPNIIIDGVTPTVQRVEIGTKNNGKLDGYVATIRPMESMRRAYARGVENGRFVQSQYLLRSHQVVSEMLYNDVLLNGQFIGQVDAQIAIYNNDVPKGEESVLVASIDIGKKTADIYNQELLARFREKQQLVFKGGDTSSVTGYFAESSARQLQASPQYQSKKLLEQAGYTVSIKDQERETESRKLK